MLRQRLQWKQQLRVGKPYEAEISHAAPQRPPHSKNERCKSSSLICASLRLAHLSEILQHRAATKASISASGAKVPLMYREVPRSCSSSREVATDHTTAPRHGDASRHTNIAAKGCVAATKASDDSRAAVRISAASRRRARGFSSASERRATLYTERRRSRAKRSHRAFTRSAGTPSPAKSTRLCQVG